MLDEECRGVGRVEGEIAAQHLIGDDAKRVEITPAVQFAVARALLRTHERWGPNGDAGGREPRTPPIGDCARDAEVGDHWATVRSVEEDVVGLDVAVHHSLPMGVVERITHIAEDAAYLVRIHRPAIVDALGQIIAVHKRHHEVHQPVLLIDAVDRNDARVRELRSGFCFAQEPRANFGTERELGW